MNEAKQLQQEIESILAEKGIGLSLRVLDMVRKRLIYKTKIQRYKEKYPKFAPYLEDWFICTDHRGTALTCEMSSVKEKTISFNDGDISIKYRSSRDYDIMSIVKDGEIKEYTSFGFLLEDNLILDIMREIGLFGLEVKDFLKFLLEVLGWLKSYEEFDEDYIKRIVDGTQPLANYLELLNKIPIAQAKSARK